MTILLKRFLILLHHSFVRESVLRDFGRGLAPTEDAEAAGKAFG
jgi:hypothetical protein